MNKAHYKVFNIKKFKQVVLVALFAEAITSCGGGNISTPNTPLMCGTVSYPGALTPTEILESSQVWSFLSSPNLRPMKISVTTESAGLASGFTMITPFTAADVLYGQPGALMMDNSGNPLWFHPLASNLANMDFKVQRYYESPVLTFWQGSFLASGLSAPGSCYYILDNHYQIVKTVTAQNGFTSDGHEFLITPNNTALFIATKDVLLDLRPYGGAESGIVLDYSIQEIDLSNNKLIFFWDALKHIPITNTYESVGNMSSSGNIWDVYHMNAVSLTDDHNDILVSGRNTWTIYRINKPTGNIVWQLGGKQSSFTIESSASFSWQHDARFISNDLISMFDDNCCSSNSYTPPETPYSHGLFLRLNFADMTAKFESSYYHNPNVNSHSEGNLQILDNGNIFIGWGGSPHFSEFAMGGNDVNNPQKNLLYDATIPGENTTYRAYRYDWKATPFYPPNIVATSNDSGMVVYASWNGSTETKFWQIYAGTSVNDLKFVTSIAKTGFETTIPLAGNNSSYVQVKATDTNGSVLGVSAVITPTK